MRRPRRAVYLYHRRRAVGRCARRRADPRRCASAPAAGLRVAGIGGEQMREEGVESLVPLSELAVAGLAEVLPHAPRLLRRIRETVAAIRAMRPDAVVTIDSSGFCWRVAHRLRRAGERMPLIALCRADGVGLAARPRPPHGALVRPRADPACRSSRPISRRSGSPPAMSGIRCSKAAPNAATRRGSARRTALPPDEMVLTRAARQPRRRGAPADCRYSARRWSGWTAPSGRSGSRSRPSRRWRKRSRAGVADWPGRPIVLHGPGEKDRAEKYDAFAASRAALAASGTVALELALARVPMAVAYRLNPLTEALLDRIVKVRQVNLVNLLLGESLVPGASARRLHAREARRLAGSADPGRTGSQRPPCRV